MRVRPGRRRRRSWPGRGGGSPGPPRARGAHGDDPVRGGLAASSVGGVGEFEDRHRVPAAVAAEHVTRTGVVPSQRVGQGGALQGQRSLFDVFPAVFMGPGLQLGDAFLAKVRGDDDRAGGHHNGDQGDQRQGAFHPVSPHEGSEKALGPGAGTPRRSGSDARPDGSGGPRRPCAPILCRLSLLVTPGMCYLTTRHTLSTHCAHPPHPRCDRPHPACTVGDVPPSQRERCPDVATFSRGGGGRSGSGPAGSARGSVGVRVWSPVPRGPWGGTPRAARSGRPPRAGSSG